MSVYEQYWKQIELNKRLKKKLRRERTHRIWKLISMAGEVGRLIVSEQLAAGKKFAASGLNYETTVLRRFHISRCIFIKIGIGMNTRTIRARRVKVRARALNATGDFTRTFRRVTWRVTQRLAWRTVVSMTGKISCVDDCVFLDVKPAPLDSFVPSLFFAFSNWVNSKWSKMG